MKKTSTPVVRWWQPPFLNSPDRAIDLATREFLAAHSDYTLGHLLVYLSQRVPTLRTELVVAAAAKRRRAHAAKVRELIIEPHIAA